MSASDSAPPRTPAGDRATSERHHGLGLLSPNRYLPMRMQRSLTPFFDLVSWQDITRSGGWFLVGIATFVAHNVLGLTLSSMVAHLAAITLAVSALIALHNGFNSSKEFPQLWIPVSGDDIKQFAAVIGERTAAAIIEANHLLSWRAPAASVRAWSYSWLAVRFSWIATAPVMTVGWLLAFTVAPLYSTFQPSIDGVLHRYVIPPMAQLHTVAEGGMERVQRVWQKNKGIAPVVGGTLLLIALYIFWESISISSILTGASFLVVGNDILAVAAEGEGHED